MYAFCKNRDLLSLLGADGVREVAAMTEKFSSIQLSLAPKKTVKA